MQSSRRPKPSDYNPRTRTSARITSRMRASTARRQPNRVSTQQHRRSRTNARSRDSRGRSTTASHLSDLAKRQACLSSMPVEIRLIILQFINDLSTLMKACHASPCLWRPYATCKELVVEQVLRNEVGPDLFPIAVAADWNMLEDFQNLNLHDETLPALLEYGNTHLRDSATVEGPAKVTTPHSQFHSFNPYNGCLLSRGHGQIMRLAELCASDHSQIYSSFVGSITPYEMILYQKTLYRWSIFHNFLVGRFDDEMYDVVWLGLWKHFTPWEFLQTRGLLQCIQDLLVAKLSEELRETDDDMQTALIDHIVSGEPLPRNKDANPLVSADVWSFHTKNLLPIVPWTDLGTISDYLSGRATANRLMDYLLGALYEENDYPLDRAADFLLEAKLEPWSSAMQVWKDPLIGKDSMVPKHMLQELKDTQELMNGTHDFWLWACIIDSICIHHDEDMLSIALPLMEELEYDIPPAYLFWNRGKWNKHPELTVPTITEMMRFIEASQHLADFI